MGETTIQWADKTWNPTRGCSLVSEGCRQCYAMKQAHHFSRPGAAYDGLTKLTMNGPQWTGKVVTVPGVLEQPLSWRKPQRVFVNSMSDLFHEDVPFEFIGKVFAVMTVCRHHTFQILTKRPERMREFCARHAERMRLLRANADESLHSFPDFLPNVWLGVSCEDQKTADERIPLLLQTPAAVRFVSYEPALGPVEFDCGPGRSGPHRYFSVEEDHPEDSRLDWVIIGGESGNHVARPFNIQWARDVIAQCKSSGVACFMKQVGSYAVEWYYVDRSDMDTEAIDGDFYHYQGAPVRLRLKDPKGGDPLEWPEDLRVREWPRALNLP